MGMYEISCVHAGIKVQLYSLDTLYGVCAGLPQGMRYDQLGA